MLKVAINRDHKPYRDTLVKLGNLNVCERNLLRSYMPIQVRVDQLQIQLE